MCRLAALAITSPPFSAVAIARFASLAFQRREALGRAMAAVNLRINGVDIDPRATLGPGLLLQHPVGVVIGGGARLGDGCTLMGGVVLGRRSVSSVGAVEDYPKLSDGVFVGANAVLLGDVIVGANSKVAAGSVLLRDVPAGATALGVPALIKIPQVNE